MKPRYSILKKDDIKYWITLVLKVSNGFELDEKEMEVLGLGLSAIKNEQMPNNLKSLVRKAEKYYEENR